MSTLLLSLARENPWPGLAVASVNLIVALFLVGARLLLSITISLLAWLDTLVGRKPPDLAYAVNRSAVA